jgi:hypothetical protein
MGAPARWHGGTIPVLFRKDCYDFEYAPRCADTGAGMEEREKVRRGLLGLLLAIAASLVIWAAALAVFVMIRRASPGTDTSPLAAWPKLRSVPYAAIAGVGVLILLGLGAEIRRVLRARRSLRHPAVTCLRKDYESSLIQRRTDDAGLPADAPSEIAAKAPEDDVLPIP